MQPIIGITVDSIPDPDEVRTRGKLSLNWNYAQAVADAGGIPILIPPMADAKRLAGMIDGLLIPGGADINAERFGEENHPKVELQDPVRYEGEADLVSHLDSETPILGICYGCQFLNVVRGGTLIQHLPDAVGHESHSGGTLQEYSISESRLREATGAAVVSGKSYHHQAVKDLGQNLRVVATADDGTIEALEATDRPWVIGVQWHPERTLEDPATRHLFQAFVAAAAQHSERKRAVAVQ